MIERAVDAPEDSATPQSEAHKFTRKDFNLSAKLAGLFSIRMLGIFIILPIYSLYTQEFLDSTPLLAGLFISSYAMTQILLQPLFGTISDYFGRKKTIVVGMLLFIIGSLVIAFSSSIYVAILGRVIQGTGAVSAVVLALTSDLTREEIRGKAMALIGISIGLTFGVAIFLSPLIFGYFGGFGIFLFCALLGVLAIYITLIKIPTPKKMVRAEKSALPLSAAIRAAFNNADINRLYFGGFMVHLTLTLGFTAFPWLLNDAGFGPKESWKIYLPSFIFAIVVMFPAVGMAERLRRHRPLFLAAILCLVLGLLGLSQGESYRLILLSMMIFFLGFNLLEATQPSLMSRFAPQYNRGMVMGLFSSSQFIGAAVGGIVGSLLHGHFEGYNAVFYTAIILLLIWFIIAFPMKNPVKKVAKVSSEEAA